MVDRSTGQGGPDAALDPRTVAALRAVLALDPDTAAEVRERSPSRRRPVPQYGPRLDLGGRDDRERAGPGEDADGDGSPAAR